MHEYICNPGRHFHRRTLLKLAGASGISWLTPLANSLARAAEADRKNRAKSLIVLWLEGGPSQLETFDPHPGSKISYGSQSRPTNVSDIQLGAGFEQLAEQMDSISLVRSVVSREGDHERAMYNLKTGYRPEPTVTHPAIGSILCHQLENERNDGGAQVDIPRHISIIPGNFPGRGGFLGDRYDAFKIFDPDAPIPDIKAQVEGNRQSSRLQILNRLDQNFVEGKLRTRREHLPDSLRDQNLDAALRMMSSEQLSAFELSQVSPEERLSFGDTSFGRGCLAAIRLIEVGVRCVEVTLGGWDTHVNNHELQGNLIKILDPAFASLILELKKRDLLETTLVLCGGEFGRTPVLNPLGGRDHWPTGFSIALAGGRIAGGRVIGATSSDTDPLANSRRAMDHLVAPQPIENIHATILEGMGIDYREELETPIGRPLKLSEGRPIKELFKDS